MGDLPDGNIIVMDLYEKRNLIRNIEYKYNSKNVITLFLLLEWYHISWEINIRISGTTTRVMLMFVLYLYLTFFQLWQCY